jgi:hypothetical protein
MCSSHYKLFATLVFAACATPEPSSADDDGDSLATSSQADTGGIEEGTHDAVDVLRVANTASYDELHDAAGLAVRAAEAIVAVRIGDDELPGTADDTVFATLAQLDAVPWVGPVTFHRLLAYAHVSTCGDQVEDPGEQCCTASDAANHAAALPAHYLAHALASVCVPPVTASSGGVTIRICTTSTCSNGSAGCNVGFAYSDAALSGDAFAAELAIAAVVPARVTILGISRTCTATLTTTDAPYNNTVAFSDDGHSIATAAGPGAFSASYHVSDNCGGIAQLAAQIMTSYQTALRDTILADGKAVLDRHATACAF